MHARAKLINSTILSFVQQKCQKLKDGHTHNAADNFICHIEIELLQ